MTLSKKLYLGSTAAIVASILMGGFAWYGLSKCSDTIHHLTQRTSTKLLLLGDVISTSEEMIGFERAVFNRSLLKDNAKIDVFDQKFQQSYNRAKQKVEAVAQLLETQEGIDRNRAIARELTEVANQHAAFIAVARSFNPDETQKAFDAKVQPALAALSNSGTEMLEFQRSLMMTTTETVQSSVSAIQWTFLLLLTLAGAVAATQFLLIRRLNAEVSHLADEMMKAAEQVNAGASQISSASQKLAETSCEQAAAIEETSASTEEINSMTRRNSENSTMAARLVDQSVQGFARSNKLLDEMLLAMDGISESSDKIARIIKVIDEIAFQTNILALNAAVEAARAGEAGMGFAVVADEVRNLAQRCAQAAKDTAELIEDSISRSRGGKTKVDETATSIRTVSEQAVQMKTLVDEVTLGSVEQTRGIEQISKALSQMDQATQAGAAHAEEGASSAHELKTQAANLLNAVAAIQVMLNGGSAVARPHRQASVEKPGNWSGPKSPLKPIEKKLNSPAKEKKFSQSLTAMKQNVDSATSAPIQFSDPDLKNSIDEFPLEESFSEF